ncbi:MAG: NADH-quinone oxidoreductase subunit [Aeromicrobium sp.]|jgi:NADH-quinone oxidoreductase subunit L|nr:NADH-quinone oxidoreductase subunit [Aeromicrobium sp.]MCW2789784.1 NADH-quinone oxidoreductase subunit [Aeromicrobium sp.]
MRSLGRHWVYVALTAALAVAVAIWAIPKVDDHGFFGALAAAPSSPPPLPSLSPDLFLVPAAAQIALLAVGIGLLVQIYSTAYLGHHPRYRSYALIIVLFLGAMLAVVGTSNLWVLLVGWEVMGLCSYLLIGHEWQTGEARAGAAKAFLVTRIADLGLVLAILVIGETYGTYDIIGAELAAADGARSSTAIGLLVLVAVMGKSAQFPLHTWLPDAMPGPTPITALIHAATMVAAGVYLAARLFPLYADSEVVLTAMAVVAGITMLLGALLALVQTDLKRALAWSTVSQLAFMFAAIATGDPEAGTDHLLSHGVFKALLFLGCGCLMRAVGSSALSAMGGLRDRMPTTFVTMTIGFAALAGIIPTVGFFTKDSVLHAVFEAGDGDQGVAGPVAYVLLVVALVTSFLTAAYATRLWVLAFFAPAPDGRAVHEAPRAMVGPLVVLAVATFALSIGQPFHHGIGVLGTLVALGGVGVVLWRWHSGSALDWSPRPLAAELGIDRAYDHWIPSAARMASRGVINVDSDAVDAYPRGSAVLSDAVSKGLSLVQSRNVQRYATVIAIGVVLLTVAAVVWS